MQALFTIISSVVSGEATDAVARARRAAMVYVVAALLVMCGVAFLVVAGFIAAAREIGSIEAALAFGGGFLGLAIVILIVHRITAALRARRIAKRRKTEARAVAGAAALALLPTLLASRAGTVALVAPALAAVAYAIYRENAPKQPGESDSHE